MKNCMGTNFMTYAWKTISKSCWMKDFIVWQLQSLKNSGSRWRPYRRKPQMKLLDCQPGNIKTGLMKQIRKSKSCSKKNTPATIICLQNLLIKLPRLHSRLPAVHSRLSLVPCRMIGEQHLLREHNTMLTWVTCAPSMRHWRPSMDLHIRSKPLFALWIEVPCWQTKKPSSSAGQSILIASSDLCIVQESSLAKILQVDVKLELDDAPSQEIKKATTQLKESKSPGINGIPAEVYQYRGKSSAW